MTEPEAGQLKQTMKKGQVIQFLDDIGRVHVGKIRIRSIRCGKKGCTKCPHGYYAYARYYSHGRHHEKYIGRVK